MTQDKMRKLITAGVVAATALLVILLSVLVYQWIKIGVYNKRIEETENSIAYWEEQNQTPENDLEYYTSDYYKWFEAIKLKDIEENK